MQLRNHLASHPEACSTVKDDPGNHLKNGRTNMAVNELPPVTPKALSTRHLDAVNASKSPKSDGGFSEKVSNGSPRKNVKTTIPFTSTIPANSINSAAVSGRANAAKEEDNDHLMGDLKMTRVLWMKHQARNLMSLTQEMKQYTQTHKLKRSSSLIILSMRQVLQTKCCAQDRTRNAPIGHRS